MEESKERIKELLKSMDLITNNLFKEDILKHIMIIGYVDTGDISGFISTHEGLETTASLTTFLLDYASKNIKKSVEGSTNELVEELRKEIEGGNEEDEQSK